MPSCVFIRTCWSLSEAYCIPGKLCHFQSSGIFKLQKNGWHYEKTNAIFGLSAPKNIKKHQKIKIKKTRPKIRCPVIIYLLVHIQFFWKSRLIFIRTVAASCAYLLISETSTLRHSLRARSFVLCLSTRAVNVAGFSSVCVTVRRDICYLTVLTVRRVKEYIYVVWTHIAWARVAIILLQCRTEESTRTFR